MMNIKIYCNYGVLSAERRNVYTYGAPHSAATCWEEMAVEIPEDWEAFEDAIGNLMVTAPWGWTYEINEVLSGDKMPCFKAFDNSMKLHRTFLKVVE